MHRGALTAMGYWNDPERTAERFRPAPGADPASMCAGAGGVVGEASWSATKRDFSISWAAGTR